MIKINGWEFDNFPKKINQDDYDHLVNLVKKKLSGIENLSVFMLNSGKSTSIDFGFTDLDFIVVVDNVNSEIRNIFSLDSYHGNLREVLYHDDLCLPYNLASEFNELCGSEKGKWDLIYGPDLSIRPISRVQLDFRIWDDLIVHTVREIYQAYFSKKIDVRALGHKLNSIRYRFPKWIFQSFTPKFQSELEVFDRAIKDFRKNWFKRRLESNCKILISLLHRGIALQEKGIVGFNNYIKGKYVNSTGKSSSLVDAYYPILFKNNTSFISESEKLYHQYHTVIPVFPPELSGLIYSYVDEKGILSQFLRKNLQGSRTILKNRFLKSSKRRIVFYNQQLEYSIVNKLEYGPLMHFKLHETGENVLASIKQASLRNIRKMGIKKIITSYLKEQSIF